MAKSKKTKKAAGNKKLTGASLIAAATGNSFQMTVNVNFLDGIGQATVVLFRNGVLINMQSISMGGDIVFSDVQSGDALAVNGVCAGDAIVTINVPTNPPTPQTFQKIILGGYSIL